MVDEGAVRDPSASSVYVSVKCQRCMFLYHPYQAVVIDRPVTPGRFYTGDGTLRPDLQCASPCLLRLLTGDNPSASLSS